jgi:hypothetical protein
VKAGSDFEIEELIWKQIRQETAAAVKCIPSVFVWALGDIAEDLSSFTAESWGFWFIYLAPHLLKGQFQDGKYYDYAMSLIEIMKVCLKLEISTEDLDNLEAKIIQWVVHFEEYIYFSSFLTYCPLTIYLLGTTIGLTRRESPCAHLHCMACYTLQKISSFVVQHGAHGPFF